MIIFSFFFFVFKCLFYILESVVRLCPQVKRTDPSNSDGVENGQTNLIALFLILKFAF